MKEENRFGTWLKDETHSSGGVSLSVKIDVDFKPTVELRVRGTLGDKSGGTIYMSIFDLFTVKRLIDEFESELLWEDDQTKGWPAEAREGIRGVPEGSKYVGTDEKAQG